MSDERLEQVSFASHNVIACYPDMDGARAGVEALERAGVNASNISLLGPAAEEAAEEPDTAERDERLMQKGGRATLGGAGVGAGVGGALGFLAGVAAFGIPGVGPVIGGGILAATIGGAAAGGGVGFTAGAMAQLKQSEAWELTLQDVREGNVVVGAHSDDPEDLEKAVDVLEGTGPEQLVRFDRDGNRLD